MIQELCDRYAVLKECEDAISHSVEALIACYKSGNKVLLCGNGGSCSDCEHIVGELMKGFLKKRPLGDAQRADMRARNPKLEDRVLDRLQGGLPAVSLCGAVALNTAFCNDVDPELMYAQALLALSVPGDVLIAISTSGNAANVARAAEVARALGVQVIALTGADGGRLRDLADISICVPARETYKVQELHLPVYHTLCAAVEEYFFG